MTTTTTESTETDKKQPTATDVDSVDDETLLLKLLSQQGALLKRAEILTKQLDALESGMPLQASTSLSASSNTETDTAIDITSVENDSNDNDVFGVPEHCIPIRADVRYFDWKALALACQFDVICMDPPWQLASNTPTRGVSLDYQQLPDTTIDSLPIPLIQSTGYIFIWVINTKLHKTLHMMRRWGYTYIDDVVWVKQTVNRRVAKGHGYYLQHAKETCLVGVKGDIEALICKRVGHERKDCRGDHARYMGAGLGVKSDVIFSVRRGQSQKPDEIYDLMESLVPNGKYLEIFGRRNNLRNHWVTIGNQL